MTDHVRPVTARVRWLEPTTSAGTDDLLDHAALDGFVWLREGHGFVTSGTARRIAVPTGPARLARAARTAAELLAAIVIDDPDGVGALARPRAVGALPFDRDQHGEIRIPTTMVGRDPTGRWWRTDLVGPDDRAGAAECTEGTEGTDPFRNQGASGSGANSGVEGRGGNRAVRRRVPGRFTVHSVRTPGQWVDAVEQAVAAIKDGRLEKVVLAREVSVDADAPFDRTAVLRRLRDTNPISYIYGDASFVGASPELLVSRTGDRAECGPMAGTVRQGAGDDERLIAELAVSGKDLAEHRLTVEAIERALKSVSRRLVVPERPSITRLPTVAHLTTRIEAALRTPAPTALALAGLLHPTPAVGGVPTGEAIALMLELEGFDRGRYAGPVGWVDAAGDGEWAVALRCADLDGRRARLVAGCGIVEGSDPDAEWAESQAKLEPMLRALVQV